MTLQKAIGVKFCDIDEKTGKQLSHSEIYGRVIEFLGGLDAVAVYIPYSMDIIREKIKDDKFLNNTSTRPWERASGFCCSLGRCEFIGGGIWSLYQKHGITAASCSEGVCILKEAARRMVQREAMES